MIFGPRTFAENSIKIHSYLLNLFWNQTGRCQLSLIITSLAKVVIRKMNKVSARCCINDHWSAPIILGQCEKCGPEWKNLFLFLSVQNKTVPISEPSGKWWSHPLDVFAEGLAEAGTEDLKLDVRVGAAVFEIHHSRQTRDVPLWSHNLHHSAFHQDSQR